MTGATAQQIFTWFAATPVLLYWFRSWRRTRSPHALAMLKALIGLNLVLVFGTDFGHNDWLFGIPTLANFLNHVCGLAAAYWWTTFVLYMAHPADEVPPKARVRRRILLVTLAVMAAVYFVGILPAGLPLITADAAGAPLVSVYLTAFEVYVGIAMFDVFWTCRHARDIPRGYLRTGLYLLRWGGGLGLAYAVHKAFYSVAHHAGWTPPWPEFGSFGVGRLLTTASILCLMAGVAVPAVGPRIDLRRQNRALLPLWRDLTTFAPDVLFSTPKARGLARRGVADRVRTRVTEIRDVLVGPLQPYLDADVASEARDLAIDEGMAENDVNIVTEAAVIAAALAAARRGEAASTGDPVTFTSADTDYRTEARWLAAVATAYSKSPIVALIAEEKNAHEPDLAH